MAQATSKPSPAPEAATEQAERAPAPVRKKRRNRKRFIIPAVAVVLAGAIVFVLLTRNGGGPAAAASQYQTYTVERRNLTSALSGSGTLQPADSYTVTGLVSGEILEASFEEGDVIQKGAVLYRIDPKNAEQGIKTAEENVESAQQALEKAEKSYKDLLSDKSDHDKDRADERAKLTLSSKESGQITKLYVAAGDTVNAGAVVADVLDSATMLLTVPFLRDDAAALYAGQSAEVTISTTGEVLYGKIDEVSSVNKVSGRGVPVRDVVIAVSNAGGLSDGTRATAEAGGAACHEEGGFTYRTNASIKASKGGEIEALHVREGDRVSEGQLILKLTEGDDAVDYDKQLENARDAITDAEKTLEKRRDSLETAKETLEDYVITSPIDGTVIEKTFKVGDKVSSAGNASTGMAIIYDLSYLTFDINVDELDISQIEVGQTAVITADAVESRPYRGTVTRASVKGTTASGATSYPVTIRVDETDGLLPGMNVSANIVISSSENALVVPTGAVLRGNRVLRQTTPGADPNAALPEGSNVPAGFEHAQVQVGETDGTYIEITEGLNEGDVIAYASVTNTGQQWGDFGNMTVMPGGMAPAGGGQFVITEGGPGGGFQGGGNFQGGGRIGGTGTTRGGG